MNITVIIVGLIICGFCLYVLKSEENKMKYTGTTYRPPYEAGSLLLQVTIGCAHNECTHCTMYRDVQFSTENLEQIENDLKEARDKYRNIKRFFLVNGDAFVLSGDKLKKIAKLIIQYFPEVEVITMYASVNNVKSKTDEELRELSELRINELWMGIESGNAETLDYLNVGYSLDDAYIQLERLNKANIRHIDNFILGGAGKDRGVQNAIDTAKLVNKTKTMAVSVTTLGVYGDSPLAKDVENGKFVPATEREVLEEQRKLIELIDIDTLYYGIHGINTVTFDAKLPEQKELALSKIDDALARLDNKYLDGVPTRYSI